MFITKGILLDWFAQYPCGSPTKAICIMERLPTQWLISPGGWCKSLKELLEIHRSSVFFKGRKGWVLLGGKKWKQQQKWIAPLNKKKVCLQVSNAFLLDVFISDLLPESFIYSMGESSFPSLSLSWKHLHRQRHVS